MYVIIRTIEMAAGVDPAQAIGAIQRVADYVRRKQDMNVKVTRPISGYQNRLAWVATVKSLDAVPEMDVKRNQDEEWQTLIGEIIEAGYFVPGSLHDEVHRVLG